jgi:hypothetical protein
LDATVHTLVIKKMAFLLRFWNRLAALNFLALSVWFLAAGIMGTIFLPRNQPKNQ